MSFSDTLALSISQLDRYAADLFPGAISLGEKKTVAWLFAALRQGHVALPKELLQEVPPLLKEWGGYVYFPRQEFLERSIAAALQERALSVCTDLRAFLKADGLTPEQQQAVLHGLQYPFSLITGGPGTGKTYTAAHLVRQFQEACPGAKVIFTAPTGKAAMNLKQYLPIECSTLHRLLLKPIVADLILVDESSMIDMELFYCFLKAVPLSCRLVLLGDVHQLPCIGVGEVFKELLQTSFPSTYLTTCLRTDNEALKQLARDTLSQNAAITPTLTQPTLENLFALFEQHENLTFLFLLRKGPLGIDAVNQYFFDRLFETTSELTAPIMATKNSLQYPISNGERGKAIFRKNADGKIDRGKSQVFFGDLAFPFLFFKDFELAYATSVHKAQGSEFPSVALVLTEGGDFGKKALYTAITRAKHNLFLCGKSELFTALAQKDDSRICNLSKRINGC